MENKTKMDDLGVSPLFSETSNRIKPKNPPILIGKPPATPPIFWGSICNFLGVSPYLDVGFQDLSDKKVMIWYINLTFGMINLTIGMINLTLAF